MIEHSKYSQFVTLLNLPLEKSSSNSLGQVSGGFKYGLYATVNHPHFLHAYLLISLADSFSFSFIRTVLVAVLAGSSEQYFRFSSLSLVYKNEKGVVVVVVSRSRCYRFFFSHLSFFSSTCVYCT